MPYLHRNGKHNTELTRGIGASHNSWFIRKRFWWARALFRIKKIAFRCVAVSTLLSEFSVFGLTSERDQKFQTFIMKQARAILASYKFRRHNNEAHIVQSNTDHPTNHSHNDVLASSSLAPITIECCVQRLGFYRQIAIQPDNRTLFGFLLCLAPSSVCLRPRSHTHTNNSSTLTFTGAKNTILTLLTKTPATLH